MSTTQRRAVRSFARGGVAVLIAGLTTVAGASVVAPTPAEGVLPGIRHVFGVDEHLCAPAITVDGVPEFPMFLFQEEIQAADAAAMEAAGVEFFSFIDKGVFLNLGWTGPQQQNFADLDRVMQTFASRVDEGYALPRIHLWAPDWWLAAHPSEATGYLRTPPAASFDFRSDASFASKLWLQDAGDRLRAAVRHLLDGPYGDRLMGFTLAAGMYGEWHTWGASAIPDTSEAMRQYFEDYVRAKYQTETALRTAWGNATAAFSAITIPKESDRLATADGYFLDPTSGQWVVDYYEAYHQSVVDAISWFTSIVKDESDGSLLTSVLYGYHPDMGWENQIIHHRGAAQMHRLETVDLVTSPHSYVRRGLGEHASLRTFPESVALHDKLFVDEADERTYLANPSLFTRVTTMAETESVLRRAFGQAVTHGTGMWYMDQSSGQWYDNPAFADVWAQLKKWGDYSMTLSRCRNSEIAVISDLDGEFRLGTRTDTTAKFYEGKIEDATQGVGELAAMGAGFDRFLIEDLVEGLIPDHYRVYIFPDALDLNPAERAAIELLKRDGKTLVWYWAPGYVDEQDLSIASMDQLTGFDLKKAQDAPIVMASAGFESGSFAGSGFGPGAYNYGALTSNPAWVVSGSYSALGAASASQEWFEFLSTDSAATVLDGGARYRVEFDAKTNTNPGNYFYFYAQAPSAGHAKDVGNFEWAGGSDGHKVVEFNLAQASDYRLTWGVRGGGSVSIDNIVITKIPGAPVTYSLDSTAFPGVAEKFGGEISLDPLFVPVNADMVLATGTVSGQSRVPVVSVKRFGTWTSVFVTTPPLPTEVLRWIAQDAGVHLYTSGGDPFEVGEKWISIQAATSGPKTIVLPQPSPVYDIFAEKLISPSTTTVTLTMKAGETRILVLADPTAEISG